MENTKDKMPTKKERRKIYLQKHYDALHALAVFINATQTDGKKLSPKLLAIEKRANEEATNYCNGENDYGEEGDGDQWESFTEKIMFEIEELFGVKLPGLTINADARGYALKIEDEVMRNFYPRNGMNLECFGLHRDMGGYGILAPMIDGDSGY